MRQALPGLPPEGALLTGPEMIEQVLNVGRAGLSRKEFAGHPVRFEKPFRLHVQGPGGEYHPEADYVFDASGAFAHGNALGVREYYFTGGEPFLNPEFMAILESALRRGPATVLTNGTLIHARRAGVFERILDAIGHLSG